MAHLIDKAAVVTEIERRFLEDYNTDDVEMDEVAQGVLASLKFFIDTLEVKEVGIAIPNIDDTLKEEGLDPDSKEAKVFKESYYLALEKLKAQKGE